MTNLSDTLAALSEAATQGEWDTDTLNSEGSYGSGDDIRECFATTAIYDASGKVLFDALNSDACLVHEEWDEEDGYCHASDLTSAANAAFIVALVNAYRTGQLVPVPSVERVARAIKEAFDRDMEAQAEADGFDYEPGPWEEWTDEATAVIAAMQEAKP